MKTAVIAGTPVDTKMGVDFLRKKNPGIETLYMPCAENPRECHLFQIADPLKRMERIETLCLSALGKGFDHFFVYCNSLSSSMDFDMLSEKLHVHIVTPMHAYDSLARQYDVLGVLAANNQCTKGIEDRFTHVNPSGYILGIGDLKLTEAVENGMPPAEIVDRFALNEICEFFRKNGCEAIVLGCTHFPYFKKEISVLTRLPVLDPADIMYEKLIMS
jgi:glutamate racemase